MEFEQKKSLTYIWRIENFSHCLHKEKEKLVSPVFAIKSLFESRWCFRVYPGGFNGDLAFHIVNVTREDSEFTFHYQMSVIDIDGTPVNRRIVKNSKFAYDIGRGITPYLSLKEVSETKRSTYLPQDTLTLLCRMWKEDGDMEEDIQCFARTVIGVERFSKLWSIKEFCNLTAGDDQNTTVSNCDGSNSLNLKILLNSSLLEEWLQIEINRLKSTKHVLLSCKISLLDRFGKSVKEMEGKHSFLPKKKHVWTVGLFITKRELIEKKSDLLFQDTLSLKFEFILSFGEIVYDKIESSQIGLPLLGILKINNIENLPESSSTAIHRSDHYLDSDFLREDFMSLYHEKTFSDFELESEGVPFRVHKAILCARSPVFKVMLTSNMQESNSTSLNIPDIDADTLTKLLLYMYTGTVENMDFESASKLYYAADKYQVLPLKQKCSSELKSNLAIWNVGVILVIADRHQDDELISAVHDFILSHDEEIMLSADWSEFEKSDSQLVAKTMCQIYRKKLKMKPS